MLQKKKSLLYWKNTKPLSYSFATVFNFCFLDFTVLQQLRFDAYSLLIMFYLIHVTLTIYNPFNTDSAEFWKMVLQMVEELLSTNTIWLLVICIQFRVLAVFFFKLSSFYNLSRSIIRVFFFFWSFVSDLLVKQINSWQNQLLSDAV